MKVLPLRSLLYTALIGLLPGVVSAQCEVIKLRSPQASATELFGSAVAMDAGRALVGAWLQDQVEPGNPSCNSGAAHIYVGAGASWTLEGTLIPGAATCGAYFGSAVDLSGPVAVIGGWGASTSELPHIGRAAIFELTSGAWIEVAALRAPDAAEGDTFGSSVAVHGDLVAIGAPGHQLLEYENAGAVYVFRRVASGWEFQSKIVDPFPDVDNLFGSALGLYGSRLLVGTPGDRDGGVAAGAVHSFKLQPAGDWLFEETLVASDADWYRRFGSALALHGDRALIGAPTSASWQLPKGRAYVFDWQAASGWSESALIEAPGLVLDDQFGATLDIGAEDLVIGAPFEESLTGSAYHYQRHSNGEWRLRSKLLPTDQDPQDFFGVDVAIDDTSNPMQLLIGASADDDAGTQSGAAYIFKATPFAQSFCACTPISACGNFHLLDGCRNSTSQGGRLSACGSASVSADDLGFVADGLPPMATSTLVLGLLASPHPFSDGLSCLGSPLARYSPTAADAHGTARFGPGLGAISALNFVQDLHFVPGSHLGFQVYYRDLSGPCGRGANWTRALEIEFQP